MTRLSDVAMLLSVKNEMANNLDYKNIVEIFTKAKAKKHNFPLLFLYIIKK